MGYVDDAFEKMRQKGEIGKTEKDQAISRHHRIRDVLEAEWDVRTFLTGSYDRHTKIRRLHDVDIFAVVQSGDSYRQQPPGVVLQAMCDTLEPHFLSAEVDRMAVRVVCSSDEEVASFEVVPAFEHADGGYEIPDRGEDRWIRTDPEEHARLTSSKNAECDDKWVPFIKMMKGWNREAGSPITPSFLVEVMGLRLTRPPFGRYQDEVVSFLNNALDRIDGPWPDPAGLGPDVDAEMTPAERETARKAIREAIDIAETAVELEDERDEYAAVEKWRELFGDRMPRP